MRGKGYSKLLDNSAAANPAKRKYQKRKEVAATKQVTSDDKSETENEKINSPSSDEVRITDPDTVTTSNIEDKQPPVEITEEEMTALLHAPIIRAHINTEVSGQLEKVKHLLLY